MAQELQALGVDIVLLDQAIDTTTPTGRLLFHAGRRLHPAREVRARGGRAGRPSRRRAWVNPGGGVRAGIGEARPVTTQGRGE
jgi:hypothetical protein